MKGLAITLRGIEDIAALETAELLKTKTRIAESAVAFDFKKYEELFLMCYKAQSISRVLLLLFEFEVDIKGTLASFEKNIDKKELRQWISSENSFKVICQREGSHEFSSQDFAAKTGAIIANLTKAKVNLSQPDVSLYAFIFGNKGYFGIDFSGFDLSKREHNIFVHAASISPLLAYALVRISGYDKKGLFMDTFAKSGLIPIEAAFFAGNFPVNHYKKDKFGFLTLKPFSKFNFEKFFIAIDKKADLKKKKIFCVDSIIGSVRAAERNAKIAGINKLMNFSRMDVSWLDTKYKKNQVDFVATYFHQANDPESGKIIKEFFYQMEYILSKKGKIAIMAKNSDAIEKPAADYKFRLEEKREITRGNERNSILVFVKDDYELVKDIAKGIKDILKGKVKEV